MIGGDRRQQSAVQCGPKGFAVFLVPQGGGADKFCRFVEVRIVQHLLCGGEVVSTGLAVDPLTGALGGLKLRQGFPAGHMSDVQRSIRLTSQVNGTAYRFRFGKGGAGDVVVMGGQLSPLDALTAEEIQNFSVFRVDKHSGAHFPALLQNSEKRSVVYMEGGPIIRHKDLDAGDAALRESLDFVKDAVHDIGHHGVEREVHTGLVLCPHVDAVVNGIQQSLVRVLGREIHDGGGSAHNGRVGGLVARRVPVAYIAQGGEVGVLVHAAGKNILAGGIQNIVGILP